MSSTTRGSSTASDPTALYLEQERARLNHSNPKYQKAFKKQTTDLSTIVNGKVDLDKLTTIISNINSAQVVNVTETKILNAHNYTVLDVNNLKGASLVTFGIKFTQFADGSTTDGSGKTIPVAYLIVDEITSILSQLNTKISNISNNIAAARKDLPGQAKIVSKQASTVGINSSSITPTYTGSNDTKQVIYNVGSVREAYHSSNPTYLTELNLEVNTPKKVKDALELWKSVQNHTGSSKGMIQSWFVPGGTSTKVKPDGFGVSEVNKSRYAFQFLYNPPTVSMQFQGTPAIDVTMETSGRDKFPVMGSAATSSTVSFQILINRMPDMSHYDPSTQLLSVKNGAPTATQLYGEHPPTTADQKTIYNKGTMYDVEFLLRALLGYTLPNTITGIPSADVGYVGAYPVELHLGLNLRYLVTIDGFNLQHTAFDHRMVPLFSTLTLTCSRLPYPYISKSNSSKKKKK
jgi:hypothetical protein